MGRLIAVAVGDRPGLRKRPVELGRLLADHGLEGDRHAGRGPRQLSLLDSAVLDALGSAGGTVGPGELGENLLVEGVPLDELRPGTKLRVGSAIVEITEVRPLCRSVHEVDPRALKVMVDRPGRMARVIRSGVVRPGDPVAPVGEGPELQGGVTGR
jgi:MOSC domain-containing protein YiiM